MDERIKKYINALYERGLSLREIGEKLKISHESVRQAIPKNDMRRKRISQEEVKQIVKTFEKNQSFQETAEVLGLSNRQVVYRVIAKAGKL